MPPKKNTKLQLTILKFKRGNLTIPIPLSTNKIEVLEIKQELAKIVTAVGGLDAESDVAMDVLDEDDIEVPVSELIDEEEEESEKLSKNGHNEVEIDASNLRIGVPKDKTQPYAGEWIELQDDYSDFSSLGLSDYNILAFAVGDEPFAIDEAAYEE